MRGLCRFLLSLSIKAVPFGCSALDCGDGVLHCVKLLICSICTGIRTLTSIGSLVALTSTTQETRQTRQVNLPSSHVDTKQSQSGMANMMFTGNVGRLLMSRRETGGNKEAFYTPPHSSSRDLFNRDGPMITQNSLAHGKRQTTNFQVPLHLWTAYKRTSPRSSFLHKHPRLQKRVIAMIMDCSVTKIARPTRTVVVWRHVCERNLLSVSALFSNESAKLDFLVCQWSSP